MQSAKYKAEIGSGGRSLDLLALAGLLLLAVLLLAPAWFGGKTVYYRDITIGDLPTEAFVFRSVLQGQFPIWNPLVGGGFPQLAALQPLFYPATVLFLPGAAGWLSWGMCLTLFLTLHYWLAGAFTYTLCRYWRWCRPAALTAAIAFELSGYLVSMSNFLTNLPPAALLPLVVLAFDQALRRSTSRSLAGAALALALQVSCGRPDILAMTVGYLALHALGTAGSSSGGWSAASLVRRLGTLAAITGAALIANAVMLLPAVEFVARSNRAAGILLAEITSNSFAPLWAIALVMPDFFGSVEWGTNWGKYFIAEAEIGFATYLLTLYAGITAYVLAIFARSPRRQPGLVPLLWLIWGLSSVLALGKFTPVYGWFVHLPLANYVRYPSKYFLLWTWTLSLLAGRGVAVLTEAPPSRMFLRRFSICLVLLTGGGLLLIWFWLFKETILDILLLYDYRNLALSPDLPMLNATMRQLLPALLPQWLNMGFSAWSWGAAVMGCIWLAPRRPRLAAIGIPLLLAADLLLHNTSAIFYTRRDIFVTTPPLVTYLRTAATAPSPRLYFPYGEDFRFGTMAALGRELSQLDQPLIEYDYRRFLNSLKFSTGLLYGLPNASVYGSLQPRFSTASLLQQLYPPEGIIKPGAPQATVERFARIAGAANIGYFLVPEINPEHGEPVQPPQLRDSPALQLLWRHPSGLILYRNRRVLPRAFFVTQALTVTTAAAATSAMFQHADALDHEIVLLQDDGWANTKTLAQQLPQSAPGEVRSCRIRDYTNNYVAIENSSPAAGYLILADNYYPGWTVTVDGRLRPVLLANAYARGVFVEAGRHVIEFRYQPDWFLLGLVVSCLMMSCLVTLALRHE